MWLARSYPADLSLPQRIADQIARKVNKLAPYAGPGMRTVLVVESDDIALMSKDKLHAAIADGFPQGLPSGLDELWYADSSAKSGPIWFEDLSASLGFLARGRHA